MPQRVKDVFVWIRLFMSTRGPPATTRLVLFAHSLFMDRDGSHCRVGGTTSRRHHRSRQNHRRTTPGGRDQTRLADRFETTARPRERRDFCCRPGRCEGSR